MEPRGGHKSRQVVEAGFEPKDYLIAQTIAISMESSQREGDKTLETSAEGLQDS